MSSSYYSPLSVSRMLHQVALLEERKRSAAVLAQAQGQVADLQQKVKAAEEEISNLKKEHTKREKTLQKEIQRLTRVLEKKTEAENKKKEAAAEAAAAAKRKRAEEQQAAMDEQSPNKKNKISYDSRSFAGKIYPRQEAKWKKKYEALKQFKAIHGHCNLATQKYKDDTTGLRQLSQWVQFQRTQHRMLRQGKYSTLTPERVRLLLELDFEFSLVTEPRKTWEERYDQLLAYQTQNGHTRVPQKEENGLGHWVLDQRRHYWDPKPSPLTPERKAKLEAIGFEWSLISEDIHKKRVASKGS